MRRWLAWGMLGCGPGQPQGEVPAPAPEPALPPCQGGLGARVGNCAGAFSLPTTDGGTFILEDHRGEVVVVHVASTDSAVDREVSPFLSQLLAERADFVAVDVLALDPVSPPLGTDDAASWRDGMALGQPVAWDETERFGRDWADTSLYPTILVLDPTGQILPRMHEQYEQQLPAALDAALP